MTSDGALAWAGRPFLERIQLQRAGPPIPTDQEALEALAAEVRRLRENVRAHDERATRNSVLARDMDLKRHQAEVERDAARAEVARLKDLIGAAQNILQSLIHSPSEPEIREWLAEVEGR